MFTDSAKPGNYISFIVQLIQEDEDSIPQVSRMKPKLDLAADETSLRKQSRELVA